MRNKRYIIALSIIIALALIVVILTFNCVNISEDRRWVDLARTFLYPLSCTVIGSAILAYAGLEISDKVLENYNERLSYGLSKRVIQLVGYPDFSHRLQEDLRKSALIRNKIIQDQSTVSHEADLVVVSLDLDWYIGSRDNLDQNGKDKLNGAEQMLRQVIGELDDSQALIVLTIGKLDDSAQITEDLKKRRFSTIVNAQGRVLSDIHSLLTTLPPRNGE
ncbi:hypothetical protein O3656_09265 [Pauljensenia sp. 27098_8_83]